MFSIESYEEITFYTKEREEMMPKLKKKSEEREPI